MKSKIFRLVTAAALSMAVAGGLWAQGPALSGWVSPQAAATQQLIRSAADDFIRPDNYTSAGIKDWFGVASFSTTNGANLGYAKTLEKLYIAAYYGGSFWANLEDFDYQERKVDWADGNGKTVPVYTDLTIDKSPNNRIALLLGVADMGFRLSYYTTHQFFKKDDIALQNGAAYTYYKSYKTDAGQISPQLAWSVTKNLTANGIKPYATVDLNFFRNYTKYEDASDDKGEYVATSANYIQPIFQVGLGGYTVANKGNFRGSVNLEYRLTFNAYNNEYSYDDGGKWKTIKVKGRNTSTGVTEDSNVINWIRPSFTGQWNNGPLALRLKFDLNTTITGTGTSELNLDGDKLVKDGADSKTTTFALNPDLSLAAQWRFIPKLALNAGGRVNVTAWEVATTKGSTYTKGDEADDSSYKTVNKTYGATATSLFAGVTFNPTDNLTFEATCGNYTSQTPTTKNNSLENNRVNVFSTGNDGFLNFGNILVSLKF